MDFEQNRMIRLKNEYNELLLLPKDSDVYTVVPSPGQEPPYVASYDVTYTIPTYVDEGRNLQQRTVIRVTLDSGWPRSAPRAKVIEGKTPFHVHWYEDGNVSTGGYWLPTKWLYEFFGFIGSMLQYQPSVVNVHSPANFDAVPFYNEHRLRDLPTDNRSMPVPLRHIIMRKKVNHVRLVLPTGACYILDLNLEMTGNEIIDQLIQNNVVPRPNDLDRKIELFLMNENNVQLDLSKSLIDNGVNEYDTLRLIFPEVVG